jgi:protein phosphatase
MRLAAWAGSDVGLVRSSNQDAVGCFPELGVFVVADGMGGRAEGEVASRLAVKTVRDTLARGGVGERKRFWRTLLGSQSGMPEPPALRASLELANEHIYAAGQRQTSADSSQRGSMGTTVVALLCDLRAKRAHWAHVGDSRLYLVRNDVMELLTADHTLFGEIYWDAPVVPIDLPHTSRLLRALGVAPTVEVTTGAGDLRAGDLFLLCSDGVSGMIAPPDLRRQLLAASTLEATGRGLIASALDRGGRDNASALLVRVLAD